MTDNARALTHAALVALMEALNESAIPEDFLAAADAIIKNPSNLLQLPIDLGTPDTLTPGTRNDKGRDVDNAPLVYEYLGALDRSNASDRRLWTYLAFSTYRDYMEQRWPLSEVDNWQSRVKDRWLMPNATRGKLVRHGIARLWWVAALTYDPKKVHPLSQQTADAFAYTREVFKNENRIIGFFDREVGAVPSIVRSVLEYACQDEANATDKNLDKLMRELTLVYGYRDIAVLDQHDARKLVAESAPAPPKQSLTPVLSTALHS